MHQIYFYRRNTVSYVFTIRATSIICDIVIACRQRGAQMNKCSITALRCLRAAVVSLAAMASLATSAATITVTSLADPGDGTTCTLRQAITAANTDAIVGIC